MAAWPDAASRKADPGRIRLGPWTSKERAPVGDVQTTCLGGVVGGGRPHRPEPSSCPPRKRTAHFARPADRQRVQASSALESTTTRVGNASLVERLDERRRSYGPASMEGLEGRREIRSGSAVGSHGVAFGVYDRLDALRLQTPFGAPFGAVVGSDRRGRRRRGNPESRSQELG